MFLSHCLSRSNLLKRTAESATQAETNSIVHEPETSFHDAVAPVKRVPQGGPAIRVAHSYGEPSLRRRAPLHRCRIAVYCGAHAGLERTKRTMVSASFAANLSMQQPHCRIAGVSHSIYLWHSKQAAEVIEGAEVPVSE
jgi:hypothetical protein